MFSKIVLSVYYQNYVIRLLGFAFYKQQFRVLRLQYNEKSENTFLGCCSTYLYLLFIMYYCSSRGSSQQSYWQICLLVQEHFPNFAHRSSPLPNSWLCVPIVLTVALQHPSKFLNFDQRVDPNEQKCALSCFTHKL